MLDATGDPAPVYQRCFLEIICDMKLHVGFTHMQVKHFMDC